MTESLGPHAGFILASYGITVAVIAGLIVWVIADHRAQKRRLADLEARGLRRRSAARAAVAPAASAAQTAADREATS
ncbi:heme exporter protein CcmD [Methylobrevis pamukkalensis]|uniref:Heme exporter protein D n=1 Tax=Methylobrevis pamukkalensis TaxID=1439726 RepID=A0A1E3H860_9HYPH|nr:heme exporter protein CcmD [Methylobrevis pamukkalensis]ODN72517.1 Heme exporter protein D (CcmD) [Methylobrevis pamukkalensis]